MSLSRVRLFLHDRLQGLQAELAEIDENLVRNNGTVLEQGISLARRKVIYWVLHL